MTRRLLTLLLIACLPWAASQVPTPPLVTPGGALSASTVRAALDFRADAIGVVRATVIEANRQRVALNNLVSAIEQEASIARADVASIAPLDDPTDPWVEAGIVAGQVARAATLNDAFAGFTGDLDNIRAFQTLVLAGNEALVERIVALEALAGIDDAPGVLPLAPNEDDVVVPHVFEAGALMRASDMNANLAAVDEATAAESVMAASILARLALMTTRAEAVAEVIEPQPTFTWRIGTVNGSADLQTEGYAIFRNPGPFEEIQIRWSGPNGFERDMTIDNPEARGTGWATALLPSGTYLAQATVGGVEFELPITYDATRTLENPDVDLVEATTERVGVRAWRIEGAAYYGARLREAGSSTTLAWVASGAFAEPSRVFEVVGLELDPAITYEVLVLAYTASAPWDPHMVAQQVDRSWALSEPFSPEPAGE
jgi:hypothetical protein